VLIKDYRICYDTGEQICSEHCINWLNNELNHWIKFMSFRYPMRLFAQNIDVDTQVRKQTY